MASTYSDLKIELIGTGEQVGTWGSTTNTNLGTAIGEAITGSANVSFSSADVTLTLTNTNGTQTARNLRLVCTGTSGGARNLILGSGCQIEKLYLIQNDLADTVTVKNTTGTGIAVPAGGKKFVFNNGTNVVDATSIVSLATDVTGTLPVANGGTGSTSTTYCSLTTNVTGTLPIANGGTGTTSTTFVNLASNVTGTMPVANGGTGQTSYTNGQLLIGNASGGLSKATITAGSGITVTNGSGAITITNAGGGGTVTSVGGTGTASGLTLSGTVTTSGNLTLSGSVTNAATATALQTARTIGGVSFNGTANINLPGVNQAGTQNTSGNAATATKLTTASGSAPSYSARAWVNFNGTTSGIRASGNVSSITDLGTGEYRTNFSTAMSDANYSVTTNGSDANSGVYGAITAFLSTSTTVQYRVIVNLSNVYNAFDPTSVCIEVFR